MGSRIEAGLTIEGSLRGEGELTVAGRLRGHRRLQPLRTQRQGQAQRLGDHTGAIASFREVLALEAHLPGALGAVGAQVTACAGVATSGLVSAVGSINVSMQVSVEVSGSVSAR